MLSADCSGKVLDYDASRRLEFGPGICLVVGHGAVTVAVGIDFE